MPSAAKEKPRRGRPPTGGRDPMHSIRCPDKVWTRARLILARDGISVSQAIRDFLQGVIDRG